MKKILLLFCFFLFLAQEASGENPRIVGGTQASTKNWPFLVSLSLRAYSSQYRGHDCGGALLRPRVVITAAHCVLYSKPRDFQIINRRRNLAHKGGLARDIKRITTYPGYRYLGDQYDLALLQLRKKIPGPYLRPQTKIPDQGLFQVAGWGWAGKGYPKIMRQTLVSYNADSGCQEKYSIDIKTMFCADGQNGETCIKDSGGPLIKRESGKALLFGLVSWGDSACRDTTVYTRINKKWIKRVLGRWNTKNKTPGHSNR